MRKKGPSGFSLIELLIVVAIILIIAAIAIPDLMKSRGAANESSAVASIRSVHTATATYLSAYGNGYPPTLDVLGPGLGNCNAAGLIDPSMANPPHKKHGYAFVYPNSGGVTASTLPAPAAGCAAPGLNNYGLGADPDPGQGTKHFFSNETGSIHYNTTGPGGAQAGPADPPI